MYTWHTCHIPHCELNAVWCIYTVCKVCEVAEELEEITLTTNNNYLQQFILKKFHLINSLYDHGSMHQVYFGVTKFETYICQEVSVAFKAKGLS